MQWISLFHYIFIYLLFVYLHVCPCMGTMYAMDFTGLSLWSMQLALSQNVHKSYLNGIPSDGKSLNLSIYTAMHGPTKAIVGPKTFCSMWAYTCLLKRSSDLERSGHGVSAESIKMSLSGSICQQEKVNLWRLTHTKSPAYGYAAFCRVSVCGTSWMI